MSHRCDAYQASDQMICPTCHTGWDVNDPDPPICSKTGIAERASGGPPLDQDQLRVAHHLTRIAAEHDRRQIPNRTNNQRRESDPGEFKVGAPQLPNKDSGRRFLDRALGILAAKTRRLSHLAANPGDQSEKD